MSESHGKRNELVHSEIPPESHPVVGAEGTAYEAVDVKAPTVIWALAVVAVLVAAGFILMFGVQKYFEKINPPGDLASPLAPERILPPAPQVQVHPWEDLPELRAHEEEVLKSTGKDKLGNSHVPISAAMDAVLSRLKIEPNAPQGIVGQSGVGREFDRSLSDLPTVYRRQLKEKFRRMRNNGISIGAWLDRRLQRTLPALVVATAGLFVTSGAANAQYARPAITRGVDIKQKLNGQIPLDLVFKDETGQTLPLRTYFGDKPVVLSLVYFRCGSVCPISMRETTTSLSSLPMKPGTDYNVLVVSFDPSDTPAMAAEKKALVGKDFNKAGFGDGFHFLTGSQDSIDKLTQAVGWRVAWDPRSHQFAHAAGIMVATPEGKLSRYFYGIAYSSPDIRMALVEAAKHKIGLPADYILLFCFHYDEAQGRYTLAITNLLKVAGTLTVIGILWLIYYLKRDEKEKLEMSWKKVPHVG